MVTHFRGVAGVVAAESITCLVKMFVKGLLFAEKVPTKINRW